MLYSLAASSAFITMGVKPVRMQDASLDVVRKVFAIFIVVWGLGEFSCKREGGGRGWSNLHKEERDDLYIWRNRTGLME